MTVKVGEPTKVRKGKKRDLGANAEIGRKLKQYYDSILTEEIPDRFSQLLGQLDQAEQKPTQD